MADKNALSCFLLPHFQVWEIKTRRQQARNDRWFCFAFFKKTTKNPNRAMAGRLVFVVMTQPGEPGEQLPLQHGHTAPLISGELQRNWLFQERRKKIHWVQLGNGTRVLRTDKRQPLLNGPFQHSPAATAYLSSSQARGFIRMLQKAVPPSPPAARRQQRCSLKSHRQWVAISQIWMTIAFSGRFFREQKIK